MSETIGVATSGPSKRVLRTAEEKRRIVEATFVPDASIARVARENGVNATRFFSGDTSTARAPDGPPGNLELSFYQ